MRLIVNTSTGAIVEKTPARNGNFQTSDPINNLRVITNSNGRVMTVIPGK